MDLLNQFAEIVYAYGLLKNKHVAVMPEGTLILLADLSIFFHLRLFGIPGHKAYTLPELLNMTAVSVLCVLYYPAPLTLDFTKRP